MPRPSGCGGSIPPAVASLMSKTNLPKLYESYAENAATYVGLLALLADKLEVSVESLQALGVGFAPLVRFREDRISCNWYATPERDAEGRVLGLGLRSLTGPKVMVPGSKHGLIYPIRAGYRTGTRGYVPGKHNWVRTMDAGTPCPICGKPDGCLLSAENPSDPKAVMCIRVRGSRPGGVDSGGWLHVRKSEGMVGMGGPLPTSEFPVVCVEGMSDAATALDLTLIPVGRPSNLAGLGLLRELVRGKPLILVGENDRKANGDWPGKVGIEAAFETTKNICPSVVKVFPPEDCKDLREWRRKYDLTRESFLSYVQANGSDRGNDRDLDSKAPLDIAERWLREEHTVDGIPILRMVKNQWYRYDGTCYAEVDEDASVRGRIYEWLKGRMYKQEDDDGSVKLSEYEATRSRVSDIVDALTCPCPLQAEPPCWLDGRQSPRPSDLVCFPNGVLDVHARARGENVDMLPSSPHFFTMHALPYGYDPLAACPQWLTFLAQVLKESAKIRLLQEWFGLSLIPDLSFQKLMLLIGPPGSGKSTTLEVYGAMLGPRQVALTSFNSLGEKYGFAPLVGKLAAILPDARIGRFSDGELALQGILNIAGGDSVSVRRMALPTLENVKLPCRITIATNELPELPDKASALPRRMLALEYTDSFVGKEDRGLPARLVSEVPGVLNWALEGLERLRRIGNFTEPPSSLKVIEELKQTTSPIVQFSAECCNVTSEGRTFEDPMYDAWRNWAKDHGLTGGMRLKFGQLMMMSLPSVRLASDIQNGKRVGTFHGISLTPEARNKYLAR
jgi:putative DNA primase/helicase